MILCGFQCGRYPRPPLGFPLLSCCLAERHRVANEGQYKLDLRAKLQTLGQLLQENLLYVQIVEVLLAFAHLEQILIYMVSDKVPIFTLTH